MPVRRGEYWYRWYPHKSMRQVNKSNKKHQISLIKLIMDSTLKGWNPNQLKEITIIKKSYKYLTDELRSRIIIIPKDKREEVSIPENYHILEDKTNLYCFDDLVYISGITGKWMIFGDLNSSKQILDYFDVIDGRKLPKILIGGKTPKENEDKRVPLILYTKNCLDPIETEKALLNIIILIQSNHEIELDVNKPWYYKPDAFTHLGIYSGGEITPYIYKRIK